MRLTGKVALVTGAGGGIGRVVCERFLAEGARVLAADLDLAGLADLVAGSAGRAVARRCDVGQGEDVAAAVEATVRQLGHLDTVVNLAGGSSPRDGRVTQAPEEEFWRTLRVDLYGTFVCARHAIPAIQQAGGGSIINTTSVRAVKAVQGKDAYAAAKGGVISLTRSMALEYAADRIRVNAIAPGITLTPRVRALPGVLEPGDDLVDHHLLGLVEPLDIAHLAVYLASEESRVVTGQVLRVDSGASIW